MAKTERAKLRKLCKYCRFYEYSCCMSYPLDCVDGKRKRAYIVKDGHAYSKVSPNGSCNDWYGME